MKDQWYESHFKLSNNTKFKIYHNLPETFGLSIQNAFDNWVVRTEEYTDDSFVNYIKSKNTGYYAFTEKEWKTFK